MDAPTEIENQRRQRRNARRAAAADSIEAVSADTPQLPPEAPHLPLPMPQQLQPQPDASSEHFPAPLAPLPQSTIPQLPLHQSVPPPSRHLGFTAAVALAGPVLALRLDCIDGVTDDPYVIKPCLLVHLIDARTGRYTRPATLISPPTGSLSVPGASCRKPAGTPLDVAPQHSCFSFTVSSPPPSTIHHVGPLASLPALNRLLEADASALHLARQVREQAAGGGGDGFHVLCSSDAPTHLGRGHLTPSLIFNDTLVFDLGIEDASILHNTVALFELVDDSPSLPTEARRDGGGYYRIAWGYLRLEPVFTTPSIQVFPTGLPAELISSALKPAPSYTDVPAMRVTLYKYRFSAAPQRWSSRALHSQGDADGSGVPAPAVMAEFLSAPHLRQESPLTLRAVPLAAAIPQVRYVFSTLSAGTAYTYLEPSGTGLQHTIGIPHVSHPGVAAEAYTSAAAQLQLASLAAHPALGRPNVMVSLPTDVYVNAPVKVAVRQQQTQRAPSTHELPSVMQPPAKAQALSRFHRAPGDPCAVPDAIIASLPTGKLGAMCVSISPDGTLIAAGCADDAQYPVRVFAASAAYGEVACLRGHANIIYSVSWSPDSRWLVSASGDGRCYVWHVAGHSVQANSSSPLVVQHPPPYAVLRHTPPSYVYAARFHPLAPSLIVTGAYDHGVRLWDARLPPAAAVDAADASTGNPTASLVIDPTTAALSASIIDGAFLGFIGAPVGQFMSDTEQLPALHPGPADVGRIPRHEGFVNVVEFDGNPALMLHDAILPRSQPRRLFTADSVGVIIIWSARHDAPQRPESYSIIREMRPGIFRGVPIVSMHVRPKADQLLVFGHSNIVRLFDLTTYAPIRGFSGSRCTASRIGATFSPDGRFIAAGSEDGMLTLWAADTGNTIRAQAHVARGRLADIAFPSAMFDVSWHPSQHVVAVVAFGGPFPVMVCGTTAPLKA